MVHVGLVLVGEEDNLFSQFYLHRPHRQCVASKIIPWYVGRRWSGQKEMQEHIHHWKASTVWVLPPFDFNSTPQLVWETHISPWIVIRGGMRWKEVGNQYNRICLLNSRTSTEDDESHGGYTMFARRKESQVKVWVEMTDIVASSAMWLWGKLIDSTPNGKSIGIYKWSSPTPLHFSHTFLSTSHDSLRIQWTV